MKFLLLFVAVTAAIPLVIVSEFPCEKEGGTSPPTPSQNAHLTAPRTMRSIGVLLLRPDLCDR
jgi:hypothetical protein